jgi:nucleotide-binding universal stress UspA family protein
MLPFKTILFPVDFSDRCRGAARYVAELAGRHGSKIILLHVFESTIGRPGDLDFGGLATVVQWDERVAHAHEMLDSFLKEELSSLNVERRFETGDPARTIVKIAHREKVDLVMVPTHGYSGFRRFVLGSVTTKVLHDVSCPVWTGVHMENAPPFDAICIRNVLCAVDLMDESDLPLEAASQIAAEYGAKLTVAHIVPGCEGIPERLMDQEFRNHLTTLARQDLAGLCSERDIKAELCVGAGEVGPAVGMLAKEHRASLVVIGRGHHHGLGRLRRHAYDVIRESPCPVISI